MYLQNRNTYNGEGVYIGRPFKWGNPYTVKKFGKTEAIKMHQSYIEKTNLIKDIDELESIILICYCYFYPLWYCYCYPLHCHKDVILHKLYKK